MAHNTDDALRDLCLVVHQRDERYVLTCVRGHPHDSIRRTPRRHVKIEALFHHHLVSRAVDWISCVYEHLRTLQLSLHCTVSQPPKKQNA